jgi:hypothetical protein
MIKDAQFIGYISVLDDNGDPVTGIIDAAFSKVVAIGGAVRALAVVVSEIGSGLYSFTVTPDLIGECNIRISHATYGNWRESFEVSEYSVDDTYSAVTAIVVGPQIYVNVQSALDRPVSGSKVFPMFLAIFDGKGVPLVPDSVPTIAIESVGGTVRVPETAMTNSSVGQYFYDYTITSASVLETERVKIKIVIGGVTQYRNSFTEIFEEGGGGFAGGQL